ncbi:MAG: cell division protein FtsA [Armatimonadetes bacterium]|nr:cell division protein FtsA [Armatimonadota bacterium]
MAGPDTLLGLDIGTTKVAAVIADRSTPEVRIVGAASVPCQGLRRGSVVDVAETTRAIQEAVTKAQRMAGAELDLAWVGVTGQHVSCLNSRGEVQLARANREITWTDVERVMSASVNSVSIPPDRQMIHAISRGFQVDHEPRVRNPVGLSANRLGVETHIITASRNLIDNVVRCVEQAGLGIAELVAEPLATADAVLSEEEQELGVLLMDIGGGTTDLAMFADGSVAYTGAIPAAGSNFTHDLAVALGITHPQAEQIKVVHGCARASEVPDEQMVQIPRDEEERTVSRRQMAQVIEARAHEIFRLVAQEMTRLGATWPPPGGTVLTGGGSMLTSVGRTGQEVLGCRVRLGRPRTTSGPTHLLESPSLATGVGLVYYAHREAENQRAAPRAMVRVMPVLGRALAWIRDLFSS